MCDPVSLSIASTVVGIAGTAANAMGAMKAQKKQAQEVDIWQTKQKMFRQQEQQRQEEFRQQASAAQQQGVQDVSADAQKTRQQAEEERLNAAYNDQSGITQETGSAPVSVADRTLTGQSGGDPEFTTDLAKKIAEATKGAKERIGKLAVVNSYNSSFGGLGTENPLLQQAAGSAIDRQNEFRRGSLGAFNVERAIDPVQITAQPNGLGDMFASALSMGAQGMGNAYGATHTFPAAPSAAKWYGPPKPLTGKFSGAVGLF
jgi:hypothetical protein